MKLWAISDLHIGYPENLAALHMLPRCPHDWLILAGDMGETLAHLECVLEVLRPRFRQLVWVPGNHELWTWPRHTGLSGQFKYEALVALCRAHGVLTPEDPYALFDDGETVHCVAPLFTLYDYSFGPPGLTPEQARAWAAQAGVESADEHQLNPVPHASVMAWCAQRCALTEARLQQAMQCHPGPAVLINHHPLCHELARLPQVPRMRLWCGTLRTQSWPKRFRASVVVSGHLHIRRTQWLDGIRFEEVSLGYPRQWRLTPQSQPRLRQILPAPAPHQVSSLA